MPTSSRREADSAGSVAAMIAECQQDRRRCNNGVRHVIGVNKAGEGRPSKMVITCCRGAD